MENQRKLYITEDYISNEYHLAVLDFKLARDEEGQWKARSAMAKLECLASELFGFAFCDAMHRKELGA